MRNVNIIRGIGAVIVAVIAGVGVWQGAGGGVGGGSSSPGAPVYSPPNTFNVFVSTTGSNTDATNCKRFSPAVALPPGGAGTGCLTWQKAYDLALTGDEIDVQGGTYVDQSVLPGSGTHTGTSCSASSCSCPTFYSPTQYAASMVNLTFGANNSPPAGNPPSNICLQGMNIGSFVAHEQCSRTGGTCLSYAQFEFNRFGYECDSASNTGSQMAGHCAVDSLDVGAAQHTYVDYNTIGPQCCGWETLGCANQSCANSPVNVVAGPENTISANVQQPNDLHIDHNKIYGNQRHCSEWPTSGFGSCPGTEGDCLDCHEDCFHILGADNSTFNDNELVGCDVQGFFMESVSNGNWVNDQIVGNLINTNSQANTCISVHPGGTSNVQGTFLIAYNSCQASLAQAVRFEGLSSTTIFAPGAIVKFVGNLGGVIGNLNGGGSSIGCALTQGYPFEYDYNAWTGAPCATSSTNSTVTDQQDSAIPFISTANWPSVGANMRLSASILSGFGVPNSFCPANIAASLTEDVDWQSRPLVNGGSCSPGGYEK